jgi:hypothetical protein
VVACVASIGFMFGLFFATAVFPVGPALMELKMGALLTVAGPWMEHSMPGLHAWLPFDCAAR